MAQPKSLMLLSLADGLPTHRGYCGLPDGLRMDMVSGIWDLHLRS